MISRRTVWILALFAVLLGLDVASLVLDKVAADFAVPAGDGWAFYGSLVMQPALWISLALGPVQLVAWTKILKHVELGRAYAISSLHMPLTMLAGVWVLKEHLQPSVWLGGGLITAGVILLSVEKKDE